MNIQSTNKPQNTNFGAMKMVAAEAQSFVKDTPFKTASQLAHDIFEKVNEKIPENSLYALLSQDAYQFKTSSFTQDDYVLESLEQHDIERDIKTNQLDSALRKLKKIVEIEGKKEISYPDCDQLHSLKKNFLTKQEELLKNFVDFSNLYLKRKDEI